MKEYQLATEKPRKIKKRASNYFKWIDRKLSYSQDLLFGSLTDIKVTRIDTESVRAETNGRMIIDGNNLIDKKR